MSTEITYIDWLRENDPQEARWVDRMHEIKAEVSRLDENELQQKFDDLKRDTLHLGKIVLKADEDWEEIYKLNKGSHSMQAPFCDTGGYGMNMPSKYIVLNNLSLRDHVQDLVIAMEYPLFIGEQK